MSKASAPAHGRTGAATVAAALEAVTGMLVGAGFAAGAAARESHEIYAGLVLGNTSRAYLDREQPLTGVLYERLLEAARKRAAGWPQQYAVGRANFRGHWLTVDQRVLIPRPETEGLVELVIGWADGWTGGPAVDEGGKHVPLVADIGTGSGAIAVALALEARVAGVIATDVSAAALAVALDNAAATGARDRVAFRKGPLLAPLLGDVVDAIVSNPPYVATREWEALEPAVKDHEPRLALDGGADGMAVIRELVDAAPASLAAGGLLALETDARRAAATADAVRASGAGRAFERVEVRNDLFGRPRYVIARRTERR